MKKYVIFVLCALLLIGCSQEFIPEGTSTENNITEKFNIGDEVELADIEFNIYKIDENNNELYLFAKENIATTSFSDYENSYEGSLVEDYVNRFVDDIEDKGICIKSSGIIEEEDLYELGFSHSEGLSGLPYKDDDAQEFVKYENNYWVGGYCKYQTRAWAYTDGILDSQSCDNKYGVRPIVVIEPSEIGKQTQEVTSNLSIKDIVDSDYEWTSEGGIHNPYDRFYFDCKNMLFRNVFKSTELSETNEYKMKYVDETTIQIDGFRKGYEHPAEITIVSENKLRIRFLNAQYNEGDYFLLKRSEKK